MYFVCRFHFVRNVVNYYRCIILAYLGIFSRRLRSENPPFLQNTFFQCYHLAINGASIQLGQLTNINIVCLTKIFVFIYILYIYIYINIATIIVGLLLYFLHIQCMYGNI